MKTGGWNMQHMEKFLLDLNEQIDINDRQSRELYLDMIDWQGPNIGSGIEKFPQGGDYAKNLETLGRYHTGLADGYGDVWYNRSLEELYYYTTREGQEIRMIEMARQKKSKKNLEKMIQEKEVCGSTSPNNYIYNGTSMNFSPKMINELSNLNISANNKKHNQEIDL